MKIAGNMKIEREVGLVSIIMAAYNAEKTIERAIQSALNQTYRNFELLVVDDCSLDQTIHIVERLQESDKRIILIKNKVNHGVSFSRKRGLEEAKGQWIAVLDSDDAWREDKLEKQIYLLKIKNADLLYTGSAFMDEKGRSMDWHLSVPKEISYKRLLKQNVISNSSAMVKKELYEKYYVANDKMHEDFAIWLRILKTGRIAYGVNEPLLIYRISKTSKSGNKLRAAKMNWNTYRHIGLNFVKASYYECCYIVNGIYKYKRLKKKHKD